MSKVGNLLVDGLKAINRKPQKKKNSPITARSIFGDVICDTWGYYTQPKMSEEEREEFQKFMESPIEKPPKKLTTAQRLVKLERQMATYQTVGGRRAK